MVDGSGLRPVGDLRAGVEHLAEALGRGAALLRHREDPADRVHRPDEHEDVVHERHQAADREPALDHAHSTEQQHGDEREVGQEVQLGPHLGAGAHTLDARLPDRARLFVEALLHERHPAERLDDAYAGRHLLDRGGQIAGHVLQAPRDDLVLVVKDVAEDRDRQHAHHHDQRELPVELRHQREDDDECDDGLHEPHEAEGDEPPHGADVGDRPREQLARLPVVVEGDLQALEVRVEIVPQVGLHAVGGHAAEMAPGHDEQELEQADQHEEARELREVCELVMRDRAVDDVLDDLRDRRGGGEAAQLRESEDHHETCVRPQVRHVAPQRQ
jgi:hypothetical protein